MASDGIEKVKREVESIDREGKFQIIEYRIRRVKNDKPDSQT